MIQTRAGESDASLTRQTAPVLVRQSRDPSHAINNTRQAMASHQHMRGKPSAHARQAKAVRLRTTCAFSDPIQSLCSSCGRRARSIDCTSIGSPSGVPEPCASTASGWPVLCHALRSSIVCESRLGAVRLALSPAHLTTLHRTRTERLATGQSERSTAAETHPSDATKPDARWSNEKHLP